MPLAVVIALIGAISATLGAGLVFLSKLLFEHPVQVKQVDVSAGTLLLGEVTYLNGLVAPLRTEVITLTTELERRGTDCQHQIDAVRAEADRDRTALQAQVARLLLRLDALEQHGSDAPHA